MTLSPPYLNIETRASAFFDGVPRERNVRDGIPRHGQKLEYAKKQRQPALFQCQSKDESQNHEGKDQHRRDNPRFCKHFFDLRQWSAEKAGGRHGNEIARGVNKSEGDVTMEEDTNGADDAEDDAENETGDETLYSRPPTQRRIVHDAGQ